MKKNRMNTPLFTYEEYSDYLRDWYDYAKRFGMSQKEFLERAGIKSRSFLCDVISKRKKIGSRHVDGFVVALDLRGDETEYFRLLVEKENCNDHGKKRELFESLADLRKKNLRTMLASKELEYFASWRYPVIREYVSCRGGVSDAREISDALVNLQLTTSDVKKALTKLKKWNMVRQDSSTGWYYPVQDSVVSYKDMPHPVVNDVKRSLIEASIHAMESTDKEKRHITMALKGVDESSYKKMCQKIDELRQLFLESENDTGEADRIVSLNVQLFPVAQIFPPTQKKGDLT
ncbi:hypothetical protein CHISP_2685 [Chitinispirillum alkaliphilum]|nr:hypothetical protein CHISP_2685 [Chitinispirillum alkaliphilum]